VQLPIPGVKVEMQLLSNEEPPPPAPLRWLLSWGRYCLFAVALMALGYCAYALVDAKVYQVYQARRFDQALKNSTPSIGGPSIAGPEQPLPRSLEDSGAVTGMNRPGEPLGRIEISRIGLAAMIMEGIDETTLRRAVGHIPDTALPGQIGNIALAGHRDTLFRALRNIRADDEIMLTTLEAPYRYTVDSTSVVDPDDTAVLDDGDDEILTLVTCYPFEFVGHAPKRFIVRAHRIPR
jgi:sortase A